jgi:hypothetical protein
MKWCFWLLLTVFSFSLASQTGKLFPNLGGTSLDGKKVNIPSKNGKYSIVAIAYHRDAGDQLKEWLNPVYNTFIKTEESPGTFDMAYLYDVNFVFIPLINGFKKIIQEFKKGTDEQFWQYIIDTDAADVSQVQAQLGVKDTKIPYFYVLDKEGRIVECTSGKYSDAKMEKIEDALD